MKEKIKASSYKEITELLWIVRNGGSYADKSMTHLINKKNKKISSIF